MNCNNHPGVNKDKNKKKAATKINKSRVATKKNLFNLGPTASTAAITTKAKARTKNSQNKFGFNKINCQKIQIKTGANQKTNLEKFKKYLFNIITQSKDPHLQHSHHQTLRLIKFQNHILVHQDQQYYNFLLLLK